MITTLAAAAPSLLAFLLQSMVVSAIALLAAHICSPLGAAFRVSVYRAGILSVLVLLFVGPIARLVIHPRWTISTTHPLPIQAAKAGMFDPADFDATSSTKAARLAANTDHPSSSFVRPADRAGQLEASHDEIETAPSVSPTISFEAAFALLWLMVATTISATIVGGFVWVFRISSTLRAPTPPNLLALMESLTQRQGMALTELVVSPSVGSPFVTGIQKPVVYLPLGIESEFDMDQIEAILCHELLHIRQGDCLWALLARICCAISWANPLSWVLARKLTRASEELCDELVLAAGIEPATYAGCLLRVAEAHFARPAATLVGAGVAPMKSHLSRRISLMLKKSSKPSTNLTQRSRFQIVAVAATCVLGSCLLVSANASPPAGLHDMSADGTVRSFAEALNRRDWRAVFSRVDGAKVDEAVDVIGKVNRSGDGIPGMVLKIRSTAVEGDKATVHVEIQYKQSQVAIISIYQPDEVHLKQVNGDWKIVDGGRKDGFFTQFGELSRDPDHWGKDLLTRAKSSSDRTRILSDLKQISLAILIYASKHDEKISFKQSTMKAALEPYLTNPNVWNGPDGKPLDVQLNPGVAGKSLTACEQPAACVLLSLGTKDHLQFSKDRTPFAFMDGHVKYMTRATVSKVYWK